MNKRPTLFSLIMAMPLLVWQRTFTSETVETALPATHAPEVTQSASAHVSDVSTV